MPTTVLQLLQSANLTLTGQVRWGEKVPSQSAGVYVVSLSADPTSNAGIRENAPLSLERVQFWIKRAPTIELDGARNPKPEEITNRLSRFWLPDENIVYIGMTTAKLADRVGQYYTTKLGDRRPHAGGHWIKTLSNLDELYVYCTECSMPNKVEGKMMETFKSGVSEATLSRLWDQDNPFPFANLEYPRGHRKKHGIGKSKRK